MDSKLIALAAEEHLGRIIRLILLKQRLGVCTGEVKEHVLNNYRVNQRTDTHYERSAHDRQGGFYDNRKGLALLPRVNGVFKVFRGNSVAADFVL